MDAALDDLVDTLGEPEETEQDNTTYTGPEVSVSDLNIYKDSLLRVGEQNKVMMHKSPLGVLLLGER